MKHFLLIALLFAIYFLCAFSCNAQRRHPRSHHNNDSVIMTASPKGLDVTVTYSTMPVNAGSYPTTGTILSASYNQIGFLPLTQKEKYDFWYAAFFLWIPVILLILITLYAIFKGRQDEEIYWPEDHNDSEDDSGYPNPFGIHNNISQS